MENPPWPETSRWLQSLRKKGLDEGAQITQDVSALAPQDVASALAAGEGSVARYLAQLFLTHPYQEMQAARKAGDMETAGAIGAQLAFTGGFGRGALGATLGEKFDPTILTVFGGRGAKTFDPAKEALSNRRAQDLIDTNLESPEALNAAKERVWKETGMWQGEHDSGWRFEIPDEGAAWKPYARELVDNWQAKLKFGDVFHHPELFKAYPEMLNYSVKPVPLLSRLSTAGAFDNKTKTFYLDPQNTESLSTALHEVQHGIQGIEGWPSGANAGTYMKAEQEAAKDAVRAMNERKDKSNFKQILPEFIIEADRRARLANPEYANSYYAQNLPKYIENAQGNNTGGMLAMLMELEKVYKVGERSKYQDYTLGDAMMGIVREDPAKWEGIGRHLDAVEKQRELEKIQEQAMGMYRRTAGEVESRNVQARYTGMEPYGWEYTPSKHTDFPLKTQDILGENQLINNLDDPDAWISMALYGGKRHQRNLDNLWHGVTDGQNSDWIETSTGKSYPAPEGHNNPPTKIEKILDEGFNRGKSFELGIHGTSATPDAKVAMEFAGFNPANMLRVETPFKGDDVYNLRPSEYLRADYSNVFEDKAGVLRKPMTNQWEKEYFFPKRTGGQANLQPYRAGVTEVLRQSNPTRTESGRPMSTLLSHVYNMGEVGKGYKSGDYKITPELHRALEPIAHDYNQLRIYKGRVENSPLKESGPIPFDEEPLWKLSEFYDNNWRKMTRLEDRAREILRKSGK